MREIRVDQDDLNLVKDVSDADINLRVDIFLDIKSIFVEFLRSAPDVSERNSEETKLLLVDGVAQRFEDLHIALDVGLGFEVVSVEEVHHGKEYG